MASKDIQESFSIKQEPSEINEFSEIIRQELSSLNEKPLGIIREPIKFHHAPSEKPYVKECIRPNDDGKQVCVFIQEPTKIKKECTDTAETFLQFDPLENSSFKDHVKIEPKLFESGLSYQPCSTSVQTFEGDMKAFTCEVGKTKNYINIIEANMKPLEENITTMNNYALSYQPCSTGVQTFEDNMKPFTCEVGKTKDYINVLKSNITTMNNYVNKHLISSENNGTLNTYKASKKKILKHTCEICQKMFTKPSILTAHMRKHTGEKPFQCDICSKAYVLKASLRSHIQKHIDEQLYLKYHRLRRTCEICQKMFASPSSVKDHMRSHTGEKPFQCDLCSKTFSTKNILRCHVYTHYPPRKERRKYKLRHTCEFCLRMFVTPSVLANHVRTHTGERPFRCDLCSMTFSRKNCLYSHRRTHSGERPYKCGECSNSYIRKAELLDHENTHKGIKSYACKLCPKTFSRQNSLNWHRKTHRDAAKNAFNCKLCLKPFKDETSLASHTANAHMEDGTNCAFACHFCFKGFEDETTLASHKDVHKGLRPYLCNVCQRTFTQSNHLIMHKKSHLLKTITLSPGLENVP